MKSWAKEFKGFIMQGNVVELAVGIIIGLAFAAVVSSLVENVLTPLMGLFGSPDFSGLSVKIGDATLRYGLFLNSLFAFLLIALAVFFFAVKPVNAMMAKMNKEPEVDSPDRPCPRCLSLIPKAADRCSHCTADITALRI